KADPDVLRDEITTFDHALTRPWTVTRSYRRIRNPTWIEDVCAENNGYVFIGKETYLRSADGHLMPTKNGQQPPHLPRFNPARPGRHQRALRPSTAYQPHDNARGGTDEQ